MRRGSSDGTVEPREAAAVIGREAERLERLVGDLLALARLRQGVLEVRRETVDLAAVVREAEERLRPRPVRPASRWGLRAAMRWPRQTTAAPCRSSPTCSRMRSESARTGEAVTLAVAPGAITVSDGARA